MHLEMCFSIEIQQQKKASVCFGQGSEALAVKQAAA